MDRIITSSRDRSSLLSTHKVLRNTYFLLSLTLAFSAITATASTVLMLPSPGLILTLVGMYGLMFLTYKLANKPTGILAAFALPASWVISLGQCSTPICLRAWVT
jgi:modulator of FtsH protease